MSTVKQRDRLCYKIYGETEDDDGTPVKFVCTREREHGGKCQGHLVIEDMVPPDAETVMMTCEGYDVAVRVWTTNISDSETDPPTLCEWHWMAYVPVPYDWCTLGDDSREETLKNVSKWLENYAEENPDAADSSLRCFKCQNKLHGDYVALDASRHAEDLIGFQRISDPLDIKKTNEFGPFVSCLACSKDVPIGHSAMH
jgi:hypothetical protein